MKGNLDFEDRLLSIVAPEIEYNYITSEPDSDRTSLDVSVFFNTDSGAYTFKISYETCGYVVQFYEQIQNFRGMILPSTPMRPYALIEVSKLYKELYNKEGI